MTANCDVPLYGDPGAPGCVHTADGLECEDEATTRCAAGVDLQINTTDRSVHVRRRFELPMIPGISLGDGRRALQATGTPTNVASLTGERCILSTYLGLFFSFGSFPAESPMRRRGWPGLIEKVSPFIPKAPTGRAQAAAVAGPGFAAIQAALAGALTAQSASRHSSRPSPLYCD